MPRSHSLDRTDARAKTNKKKCGRKPKQEFVLQKPWMVFEGGEGEEEEASANT